MFSRGSFQGPELWLDPTLSFVIMQTVSSPEVKGSRIHSVVCLLTQKMLLRVSSSDPASGGQEGEGQGRLSILLFPSYERVGKGFGRQLLAFGSPAEFCWRTHPQGPDTLF